MARGSGSLPRLEWPQLEHVRAALEAPDEEVARELLEHLDASAAPTLWAVLSGQALQELDVDFGSAAEMFRERVAAWPAESVITALLASGSQETPLAARLVMLDFLEWTDSDGAIPAVFELLTALEPIELQSHRVTAALRETLVPLLSADASRFRTLTGLLPHLRHDLLPPIVEVMGSIPRPEAVVVMSRAVRQDPSLRRLVLAEIGLRANPLAGAAASECIELARYYLDSFDEVERRLAARALGRLRDAKSFHGLVGLLGDDDATVRRVAREALQSISGVRRSWTSSQWSAWFDGEVEWLRDAGRLVDDLTGTDAYRAGKALRELSTHTLFVEETVPIIEHALRSEAHQIRALACQTLARIGHPAAAAPLIEALGDRNEDVRAEARQGLRALTATDLGDERAHWQAWWQSLQ